MVAMSARTFEILELVVMLLQLVGVGALFLTRLSVGSRWFERGRSVFVIALIGLGVCGALCGSQDSEFGMFAGGTMTVLLIGMTVGAGGFPEAKAPATRSSSLAGAVQP
jgi:hypothetical protein